MTDAEYLKQPLVENVRYQITDDFIYIYNEHTIWVQAPRLKVLEQKSLLELYQKVYRTAKQRRIKIRYTRHLSKRLVTLWKLYEDEVKYHTELFDKLKAQFTKVMKRGIHRGYTYDIVLQEAFKLSDEYEKVFWRTSAYSKIREITWALDELYLGVTSTQLRDELTIFL